jgi:drug/metabolite transporter (DMT)-like permease
MTTSPSPIRTRQLTTWVTLAFLFVYAAWSMTYMALHFALESLPPFLIGAGRFFLAGWILLALVAIFQRRDFHWGSAGEWRDAAVVGTILFLGGNGSVAWAQQYVNTSTAALLFGTIPLFIILFEWLRPGGVRPTLRTGLGLLMGFAGLCILIKPAPELPHTGMETVGKGVLLLGAVSWAAGAIYSRFHHAKGSPLLPMARQMICGGSVLLVISFLRGDLAHFSPWHMTLHAVLGFAYLLFFGSLLGFTAYAWLLRVSTPERVSTVSYVNTVLAVLLGWAVGEPMSLRILVGAVVVIASVVIVLKKKAVRDTVDATPTEA